MQLSILRRIISLVFLYNFCLNSVFASEIALNFAKAQKGDISISGLVNYLIEEVFKSPTIGPEVAKNKELVPGFAEISAPIFISRIQGFIAEAKFEQAWAIKTLLDNTVPESWPETKKIKQLFEAVSQLEEIQDKKDIPALTRIDFKNQAEEDLNVLENSINHIAGNFLEQTGKQEDQFIALKQLAELSASFPELPLKAKAKEAIKKLSEDNNLDPKNWSFDNPVVSQFIFDNFSENKQELLKLYTWKILAELEAGNQNRASISYSSISPALNEEDKNILRKEILRIGLSTGLNPFVAQRIDELKAAGQLSALKKIILIFRGYYGWIPLVLPLLLILPFFRVIKHKKKAEKKYTVKVADDEYTVLLRKLGLEGDASEAQIKKAFRQLVKEHHPDAHGTAGVVVNPDGKIDQKFEQLRKTYDRIMEIRGSMFGANK